MHFTIDEDLDISQFAPMVETRGCSFAGISRADQQDFLNLVRVYSFNFL